MQYLRRSVEFRLLREHIISRQAYQHGISQWFGGRMLDAFLLLSVSSGLQDGARDDYLKKVREYLDAVSALADPSGTYNAGAPRTAQAPRQATDDDRTRYLGLMTAGLHKANKQGFASLKELRQAMEALRETVDSMRDNSFNGTTGDSK